MSDSNRPPTDYKSVALPDELMGQFFTTLEFYPTSQFIKVIKPSF
jgi:hypothetical protein